MATPLQQWFLNLASIQGCVRGLRPHETKLDLRDFSRQTLNELIGPDTTAEGKLRQGNLCLHCTTQHIGPCPANAFADLSKNFTWFLDNFAGGNYASELLLAECLRIARALGSALGTIDALRGLRFDTVFTTASDQQQLNDELTQQVSPSFFRDSVKAVAPTSANLTMQEFCDRIMS